MASPTARSLRRTPTFVTRERVVSPPERFIYGVTDDELVEYFMGERLAVPRLLCFFFVVIFGALLALAPACGMETGPRGWHCHPRVELHRHCRPPPPPPPLPALPPASTAACQQRWRVVNGPAPPHCRCVWRPAGARAAPAASPGGGHLHRRLHRPAQVGRQAGRQAGRQWCSRGSALASARNRLGSWARCRLPPAPAGPAAGADITLAVLPPACPPACLPAGACRGTMNTLAPPLRHAATWP